MKVLCITTVEIPTLTYTAAPPHLEKKNLTIKKQKKITYLCLVQPNYVLKNRQSAFFSFSFFAKSNNKQVPNLPLTTLRFYVR